MAKRRSDEEELPGALAALETARDETLAAMAGSQNALDLAQDELDRSRETLRGLPNRSAQSGPAPPSAE